MDIPYQICWHDLNTPDLKNKMPHKKEHLPTKICPVCNRPFTWRKKWERDWQHVKYCSKRCKKQKNEK